jgi:hypothetical protein
MHALAGMGLVSSSGRGKPGGATPSLQGSTRGGRGAIIGADLGRPMLAEMNDIRWILRWLAGNELVPFAEFI